MKNKENPFHQSTQYTQKSHKLRQVEQEGEIERKDLDIMESTKLQPRTELERGFEESIEFLKIVVNREVFGDEAELGLDNLALAIVLERELELGQVVKELARDFVEEEEAVTVELGGYSHGGPL